MSVAIYFFGVLAVVAVMLSSYFLGEQSNNRGQATVYESGIKGFGSSRVRFFTHYFLLAILFVIFDLESVFLYLWSSSIREVGWMGLAQMAFFIGMLVLTLFYAISAGVLNIAPKALRKEKSS